MVDNALRCTENDYPALLGLAQAMGVITLDGSTVIPADGILWDHIGYKYVGDAPLEGEPDTRTILSNPQGHKYIHINVRTPFSVGEAAMAAAAASPEIAAALGDPSRFFVTNPDGTAKDPEFPMRVFL
jgi:hypothetical protein